MNYYIEFSRRPWRQHAERWDVREALRREIQLERERLARYEQSLVDGLRVTEPRVPLKERAVVRRRAEIVKMRAFLAEIRDVLARQTQTTLRPWPGYWEALNVEEHEALVRDQAEKQAGRPRHGLRVLAGGRA